MGKIQEIKFEKISFKQFKRDLERDIMKWNTKMFTDTEIEEMYHGIRLPERSTRASAGYDFFAPYCQRVPNDTKYHIMLTGIKVKMPEDIVLMLYPRSGLGVKNNFRLLNTAGVIDSDYYNNEQNEGHIKCMYTARQLTIERGDKFMQGIFIPFKTTSEEITPEEIRAGGFGSTGKANKKESRK